MNFNGNQIFEVQINAVSKQHSKNPAEELGLILQNHWLFSNKKKKGNTLW